MADSFDIPVGPIANSDGLPTIPWAQVFSRWHRTILASIESGATANRPTKGLWVGRQYFDTTLGKPIWLKTVSPAAWVTADGAPA